MSSVLEIADPQFEQELNENDKLILVYFWAPWCGPCRLVSPSINAIATSYGDRLKVLKLEVDPNPDARSLCKVEGVPAIRLFWNRELLASHEGAIAKLQLQEMIDIHIS